MSVSYTHLSRLQRRAEPRQHHRALLRHLPERFLARHFAREHDREKQIPDRSRRQKAEGNLILQWTGCVR